VEEEKEFLEACGTADRERLELVRDLLKAGERSRNGEKIHSREKERLYNGMLSVGVAEDIARKAVFSL